MAAKKFKTDGFKMAIDFLATGLFTDAMVYKDRGYIQVILVKESKIVKSGLGYNHPSFNSFYTKEEVDKAIKHFIDVEVNNKEEDDEEEDD